VTDEEIVPIGLL